MLPTVDPPPTKDVDGITVRGLTRGEAVILGSHNGNIAEIEVWLLTCGTDTPEAAVREWYAAASVPQVGPLIDASVALSCLDDARFPDGTGPDAR